jgi:hypothetical protein
MYSIEGEHLRQLLLRARGALWYRQNREFLADCAQLFFSATDHFGSATVAFCIWLLRVRLGIPALFRSFERCIDRNQVLLGTMNKTCRRTRLFEQLLLTGSVVFFRLSDIVVLSFSGKSVWGKRAAVEFRRGPEFPEARFWNFRLSRALSNDPVIRNDY